MKKWVSTHKDQFQSIVNFFLKVTSFTVSKSFLMFWTLNGQRKICGSTLTFHHLWFVWNWESYIDQFEHFEQFWVGKLKFIVWVFILTTPEFNYPFHPRATALETKNKHTWFFFSFAFLNSRFSFEAFDIPYIFVVTTGFE